MFVNNSFRQKIYDINFSLVIDHYHLPAGSDGYNWCAALFFSGLPEESIIKKTAFVFHHPFEH